ncbi:hypothetical protein [Streptomyces olivaceiscleroticus]|uniref:ATP-binding protein n=1 Tax=Streptomyces olivaceiscleroticus TaxID=68245 RepID=A0ABN0ZKT5_9ACTN
MLALDDPALGDLSDERAQLIIRMLSEHVYGERSVADALQTAGLVPGDYPLSTARLTWTTAVPDAVQRGMLGILIQGVIASNAAFGTELERRLCRLVAPPAGRAGWYHNDDPYSCAFVGLRSARALMDRQELRNGLRDLVRGEYYVLVVYGAPRSGKSHTWVLVDHLRNTAKLAGTNRFARVTTHAWSGQVTGEDLAHSLAAKLGLDIALAPSTELDDTRVRKFLDQFVGRYPHGDGITRWIVLDGLDRPGVQDGARDLAKRLIRLVEERELQQTRLIVTGLDPLGLQIGYAVRKEEIPVIGRALVSSLLKDVVAPHFGRTVTDAELEECLREVLGPGPEERDLGEIEQAVVQLVRTRWVQEDGHGQ